MQASDATGGPDWVELTNVGSQPVDLSGWVLTDDKDSDGDVIPSGTSLNPGAFVSFEPNNENGQFSGTTPASKPFGLGATGDEVRLYEAGAWSGTAYVAADLVDAFVFEDTSTKTGGAIQPQTVLADGVTKAGGAWPVNSASPTSPETYARCSDGISQVVADGTGAWEVTSTPTEGATNQCNGLFTATPWPDTHNGQAVTTADNVDLGQNVSGLFYVGGDPTTTADDFMWAIQNGSSGLAGANQATRARSTSSSRTRAASGARQPAGRRGARPLPEQHDRRARLRRRYRGQRQGLCGLRAGQHQQQRLEDLGARGGPGNIVAQNGDTNGDLNATHEWDLGSDLGPNPGVNPETGSTRTTPATPTSASRPWPSCRTRS